MKNTHYGDKENMKNQMNLKFKRNLIKISVCLILSFAVLFNDFSWTRASFQVEAASQGLAHFEELKIDDNTSWATSNIQEGGIGTFKSLNGKQSYRIFTNMSGYTYNPGDLLSVKYDGVELADEEFMLSGDNGNVYLEKAVSYHKGYITMELPDDVGRAFKSVNPKLFRIRGTFSGAKAGDEFTIGGIEIHRAGTRPSWDSESTPEYDPYIQPKGISVTYYDDIYSRGFAWSTNDKITSSALYIIKKSGSMTETNINWNNADKVNASVVERTDVNEKKWNIFKAHVTDLTPGATYYYRVGGDISGYSNVGTLTIEDSKSGIDEVTFLHLTDSQESAKTNYDVWADVLRAGKNKYPKASFVAFSGDFTNYSYSNVNMNEWLWGLDTAADTLRNMPIAPSSGNHDGFDYAFVDRFDINWADYVTGSDVDILSGGNYFYTYGNDVIFINLNTNINTYMPESETQLAWLRGILEQYKDYKWKVVQIHKGLMSTGSHSNNYDVEYYRDKLCPIFAKYDVDLVLQGHDHVYTRSASYPFWDDNNADESEYDYKAYEEAGQVSSAYSFDGETRPWNLEPVGTHYVTINYCANKAYDTISESERDERIHLGINPIAGNGCDSQPNLPMYGVVRIKGDVLCYDAYTYDTDTKTSRLYDTFSVDKSKENEENNKTEEEKETVEENQNTTEENKDVVEEQNEPVEDNKDTVEEDKDKAEEQKESVEENKDTIEENNSTAEENKDTAEEQKESAEDNKDTIEVNKDTTKEPPKSEDVDKKQSAEVKKDNVEDKKDIVDKVEEKKNNEDAKKETTEVKQVSTVENTTTSSAGNKLLINQIIKDKKTNGIYKITKLVKKKGKIVGGNVTYMSPVDKKCKKATVKAEIKIKNITFKVTAINNNAFKNCKNLNSITIGSNITKIGNKAFYGCRKLQTIKIKSTKIKSIGTKAFAKINKNAKFNIPKKGSTKLKQLIKKSLYNTSIDDIIVG
jgi:hypothetical protein